MSRARRETRRIGKGGLWFMAVAACVLTLWVSGAWAQDGQVCAERTRVVAKLAEKFGETLRGIGLRGADGLVEIYASEETGTWTILNTSADGMACLVAAGQRWEDHLPAAEMQGDPT